VALFAVVLALLVPAWTSASTSVVAHVPVGMSPAAVAIDPISHRVFVADYFGDSVHLLDGVADSVVATVPMPTVGAAAAIPIAVVADPLTGRGWVANWQSHWVSAVDGSSGAVLSNTRVPASGSGNPRALALDPTSVPPKLYVADYHTNTVSVLDASTGALLSDIPVGTSPRALGLCVGGGMRRLFVANRYGANVSVVDCDAGQVIATAPAGEAPKAIAVDPETACAWVTSTASDTVSVIDAAGTRVAEVPVGDNPVGVAVDSAGRRVFVANYYSSSVSVIDANTRSTIATVPTAAQPYAVAFDQSQRKAYVTCYGGDGVAVIDDALVPVQVGPVGRPYGVAVDEGAPQHKAYVTEWTVNAAAVIDPVAPVTSPVTVTIDRLPGDFAVGTPRLTGSALSARAPFGSPVVGVFLRLDGEPRWRRATITGGQGSPSVRWAADLPGLSAGSHEVEVAAMDAALAVSSSSDQGASATGVALGKPEAYAFSALQRHEETDTRMRWEGRWTTYLSPTRSGGSWRYCTDRLAGVDIAFTGTRVRLVASKSPGYGRFSVSVDGGPLQVVDLYSRYWAHQQVVFERAALAPGPHALRVEPLATRNEASTGDTVGLDAVEVDGELTQAGSPFARYEETDPRLLWEGSWKTYISPTRSGGSWRFTPSAPFTAVDISFTGTGIRLISSKGPYGSMQVSLDGGPYEDRVYLYGPAWLHNQVVYKLSGLAPGPHTLRVATEQPTSAWIVGVDAVEVLGQLTQAGNPFTRFEQTDARMTWSGRWNTYTSATRSGGSWRYTSWPGSAVEFTVSGSSVRLVSSKSPGYGIAKVSVDGGSAESVDLYSPSWGHKQVVFERGLASGTHSVRVWTDGTKNAASSGTTVGVDAVDVIGDLGAPPPAPELSMLSATADVLNSATTIKNLPWYHVTVRSSVVPLAEVAALGGSTVEYELYSSTSPAADLASRAGSVLCDTGASPLHGAPSSTSGRFYQVRATVKNTSGTVVGRTVSDLLGPAPWPLAMQTLPVPRYVFP
jgi:YVTN family beta-propeller protein